MSEAECKVGYWKKPDGWYFGVLDDAGEYYYSGPYDTKKEAESDKRGIEDFFKKVALTPDEPID